VRKTASETGQLFGETSEEALLEVLRRPPGRVDLGQSSIALQVSDFTFRLPSSVLEVVREMARGEGLTMNAMMACLVDIGLQSRGRSGIPTEHPAYVAYLRRASRKQR
jgi:hypothetical protein